MDSKIKELNAIQEGDTVIGNGKDTLDRSILGNRGSVVLVGSGPAEGTVLVEWTHKSSRLGPIAIGIPEKAWAHTESLLKVHSAKR